MAEKGKMGKREGGKILKEITDTFDGYKDKGAGVNRLLFDEIPPEQLIDNSGLESRHLNGSRLHLNTAGSARLASNFRTHIGKQSL